MHIYLLRPVKKPPNGNPWEPWYDKAFGFVIAAQNEQRARELAAIDCGDEGERAWLNPTLSRCELLVAPDEDGVIIQDFARA